MLTFRTFAERLRWRALLWVQWERFVSIFIRISNTVLYIDRSKCFVQRSGYVKSDGCNPWNIWVKSLESRCSDRCRWWIVLSCLTSSVCDTFSLSENLKHSSDKSDKRDSGPHLTTTTLGPPYTSRSSLFVLTIIDSFCWTTRVCHVSKIITKLKIVKFAFDRFTTESLCYDTY